MHLATPRLLRPPLPKLAFVAVAAALFALAMIRGAPASAAPNTPHPVAGREDCLLCHSATARPAPVPADHAGYALDVCVNCHSLSAAPTIAPAVPTATGTSPDRDYLCLACHQNQNLTMQLSGGEVLPLYVDQNKFRESVHGRRLACADCHSTITAYPHPKVRYESRRAFSTAYYESCKRCHFANYNKTLDSQHFTALSAGDLNAPVCTDCHGAHNVVKPAAPRSSVSQACGKCHTGVYRDYAESVHGRALDGEENPDVPVCTTCHGVHSIPIANSASFRLASTELCARCHEDRQLMTKYGLSPNVAKTYFEDFHGRTVGFYQRQEVAVQPTEPVCVDCHGIHSIKSARDPSSPIVPANLQATCGKCHQDASPNFPAAWLGHYEPSPSKAPLVYYVRLYYWVLIPVMIGGLAMHIGLDLWRLARNR